METTPAPEPIELPNLSLCESRVLGVLVEKAKTTPDAYPLSLNSLRTGCNQKSNREPVMDLDELDVEETLLSLQKKGLVIHITGSGRVERWRHNLYDSWNAGKVDLAILAELLLRGAQTVGELRGRANRMEKIPDLEALNEHLQRLADRKMVVWLSPPGQRGAKLTHGFFSLEELQRMQQAPVSPAPESAQRPVQQEAPSSGLQQLENKFEAFVEETKMELDRLRELAGDLQSSVAAIREELNNLKNELGA